MRPGSSGVVAPVAAALVAGVLSFAGAWRVSLWSDEVATISAAGRSLPDLGRLLGRIDAVHGVYYALMHGWVSAFGASPTSIRLASSLAVAAGAAGVVVLGNRLGGARLGIAAGAVFALLPRVTWAGIEARSWAATLAVAIWATVVLHVAVGGARRRWWFGYGALVALGIGLNVYLALLVAAHGLSVLIAARRSFLPWLASAAAGCLACLVVVVATVRQGGQLGEADLTVARVLRYVLVNQWLLGETPTPTTGSGTALDGWGDSWKVSAVALAAVAWLLVLSALLRRADAAVLAWTLPWLVLPTVLVVAAALVRPSLYNARYLTFCAPALALLVAAGILALGRTAATAAAVVLVLLAAPVYASQRTELAKSSSDLLLVADVLRAHAQTGDGIYYGPRDDAVTGTVTRSLRTVALGYPDAVEGLVDVTLAVSPADGATLFGTSMTLQAAADEGRLDGRDTLWVVQRQDRAAEGAADAALLSDAGYQVRAVWDGTQTTVVEMGR